LPFLGFGGYALSKHKAMVKGDPFEVSAGIRSLKQAGQRVARKAREIVTGLREGLGEREAGGIRPENIIWIFGAGRTGSTWLSRMMGDIGGSAVWFEPWVGALFDPHHLKLERRKGKSFILTPHYRDVWLGSIRSIVLDGARARFPELAKSDYLVVKEPGGSAGAPLLMEAFVESKMVLSVRDPRDVVASWVDAQSKGSWLKEQGKERRPSPEFVDERARVYAKNVGGARKAYDSHEGRKVLVRYEDLRTDTLGTMKRIYSALEIPVDEGELTRAVEKHCREHLPEQERGQGKFYRKAKPGGWREDLTPEQAERVERITAPLFDELYPELKTSHGLVSATSW
jgi:hypothetical protein